jgi:hypothetical protein
MSFAISVPQRLPRKKYYYKILMLGYGRWEERRAAKCKLGYWRKRKRGRRTEERREKGMSIGSRSRGCMLVCGSRKSSITLCLVNQI